MLATLFTRSSDGRVAAIIANDPWTGTQVTINPKTEQVFAPSTVSLVVFTIDGYQSVTPN